MLEHVIVIQLFSVLNKNVFQGHITCASASIISQTLGCFLFYIIMKMLLRMLVYKHFVCEHRFSVILDVYLGR